MEERIFRDIKQSEIRVIKSNMVELKAEEGWLITEKDKSLKTQAEMVYLPNLDLIENYCCVNKLEEEIQEQQ